MSTIENDVKQCDNCAWYSDGFGPGKPDWCYLHEYEVVRGGICGEGWQESLRSEPLNYPPITTPWVPWMREE